MSSLRVESGRSISGDGIKPMLKRYPRKLGRTFILAIFVAANLAIARPADAGLVQVACEGDVEGVCCRWCIIFCGCPVEE